MKNKNKQEFVGERLRRSPPDGFILFRRTISALQCWHELLQAAYGRLVTRGSGCAENQIQAPSIAILLSCIYNAPAITWYEHWAISMIEKEHVESVKLVPRTESLVTTLWVIGWGPKSHCSHRSL
jgi:hypothetical protein